MNKTLIELLHDKKYQKTNVKVGSKSGSSFWYCGKGNLAYSLPEIKKADNKMKQQIKGVLYQLKYRQDNLDKIYEERIEKAIKKGVKNAEQYRKMMALRKEQERLILPKRIASHEYDAAIHLLNRPVLEIVEGISYDEKPCWIVYVKGNEKGGYWTIAEYNKRKDKIDNAK